MAIQLMLKGTAKQKKSKDKSKKGALPIFIRYSKDGRECLISTKKKINPIYWNEEKEEPQNSYPGGKVNLSRYLNDIVGEVQRAQTDLENEKKDPMPELVKERYLSNTGQAKRIISSVLGAWKARIAERESKMSIRTAMNDKSSYNSFKSFLESKKKAAISFAELDKKIISGYEEYLSTKDLSNEEEHKEGYTLNTKAKKLKHFKAFLKEHDHPLTDTIKFQERPGNKIFLTQHELALFQARDFSKDLRLDRVRDLFVLQCHTGLRVSDLKRLQDAHITDSLTIRAQKNNEFIKMPVTPSIKAILTKYNNKIPAISDQKYNDYIKEVAKAVIPKSQVEITEYRGGQKTQEIKFKHEVLSSHDAVKTFITLKAGMGMPISSIAVLTGKTVQVILKNYLGKDEDQAQRDALKYDFAPLAISQA